MAWGRKSARIAELEAENRNLAASVENVTASRDAQTRYATEKVVEIQRLQAAVSEASTAIGCATETIDAVWRHNDLLVRVGDRLAAKAEGDANLRSEWEAAKNGVAWRDDRGRFLPRGER